ncbi:MAG: hypothetical protein QOH55_1803 [Microbacteriaceae bacterium]|jgi:hypothetical protein|nr:hypothetical protein [Microbacteriaceae bacterium]
MSIKAKTEPVDAVSVVIVAPFQASHEGAVYGPGDTAQVPAEVAAAWVLNGWATIADPT